MGKEKRVRAFFFFKFIILLRIYDTPSSALVARDSLIWMAP